MVQSLTFNTKVEVLDALEDLKPEDGGVVTCEVLKAVNDVFLDKLIEDAIDTQKAADDAKRAVELHIGYDIDDFTYILEDATVESVRDQLKDIADDE